MIPGLGAYYRPDGLEEALALLATDPACHVLAGGTDLLLGHDALRAVLDLGALGLDGLAERSDGLHLGAMLRVQDLLESPLAAGWADGVLRGACLEFGTLQVRHMATVGGNVAHALPAADLVPALLALDAEVEIASTGPGGGVQVRRTPLDGFATGPCATILSSGEIITGLVVPARTRRWRAQYRKVGRVRKDLAQVNAAAALEFDDEGRVREARVVLGAVHPTVTRVRDAESALVGGAPGAADWPARVARAVDAGRAGVRPISDQRATREWRRHVCGVLLARCLAHCSNPARAGHAPRLEDGPSYCAGLVEEGAQ